MTSSFGFNSADYLHVHVEAKKLAFADRAKFYADPDFGGPTEALVEGLISKRYAAERAPLIDMSHAAKVVPPRHATFRGGASLRLPGDCGGAVAGPHVSGHNVPDGR